MMREIKFRAWDKESGVWLDDDEYVIKPVSGLVSEIDYADGYVVIAADNHDAILEEFTGLKDENGVEIYENDIIRDGDDGTIIGIVEYIDGQWIVGDNLLFDVTVHDVIGNIHENENLLEKQS